MYWEVFSKNGGKSHTLEVLLVKAHKRITLLLAQLPLTNQTFLPLCLTPHTVH